MSEAPAAQRNIDVVIFGGGGAGLWLLDELLRRGLRTVVLESDRLGSGQTVASQGIIHGGLKYSLRGLLTPAAAATRDMPLQWHRSLAGRQPPLLTHTRLRAEYCYLWQSGSITSGFGMLGARAGLRVRPVKIKRALRPAILAGCPGVVARLNEPVVEPASLLDDLAGKHPRRLLKIDAEEGLDFDLAGPGVVESIRLTDPGSGQVLTLRPRHVVLTAGAGNAALRSGLGLSGGAMQRRPLNMVLLRGDLPALAGHCIEGMGTRVTITTTSDSAGRTVWQVGGRLAEAGRAWPQEKLLAHARCELMEVLPALDLNGVQWATYIVDRAEAATSGRRPDDVGIVAEGNVITAWPTKLALVPRLAAVVSARLPVPQRQLAACLDADDGWPRPEVALPPWERVGSWHTDV